MTEDERTALMPSTFSNRSIQGAYHCALTTSPLPKRIADPYQPAASGDIHLVADGNGNFSDGSWTQRLGIGKHQTTCKLKMMSGTYAVGPNGTGSERSSWKLDLEASPHGCFEYFSPARPPFATDQQLMTSEALGKMFYTTSMSPLGLMSTVCEVEPSPQ